MFNNFSKATTKGFKYLLVLSLFIQTFFAPFMLIDTQAVEASSPEVSAEDVSSSNSEEITDSIDISNNGTSEEDIKPNEESTPKSDLKSAPEANSEKEVEISNSSTPAKTECSESEYRVEFFGGSSSEGDVLKSDCIDEDTIKYNLEEVQKELKRERNFSFTVTKETTLTNNLYIAEVTGFQRSSYELYINDQEIGKLVKSKDDIKTFKHGYDALEGEKVKITLKFSQRQIQSKNNNFSFSFKPQDKQEYGYKLGEDAVCERDYFKADYFKEIDFKDRRLTPSRNEKLKDTNYDALLGKNFDEIEDIKDEEKYLTTRCEKEIDYKWNDKNPHLLKFLPTTNYGVRYSKEIKKEDLADKYEFKIRNKDFHRLILDNEIISLENAEVIESFDIEKEVEDKENRENLNLIFEYAYTNPRKGDSSQIKLEIRETKNEDDKDGTIPEKYMDLYEKSKTEELDVIISLNLEYASDELRDKSAEIIDVLEDPKKAVEFKLTPAVSVNKISAKDFENLAKEGLLVESKTLEITEKPEIERFLGRSTKATEADIVSKSLSTPYTGAGNTIIVLDDSSSNHPFFASRIIDEYCFADSFGGNCAPTATPIINSRGAVVLADSGIGAARQCLGCDHGIHVAGIAAGDGGPATSPQGVAPGANLIMMDVFQGNGSGSWDTIIAALDETFILKNSTNPEITAVNMSLGADVNQNSCNASIPALTATIDQLKLAGVASLTSSGNANRTNGMGIPACIDSAIAVGGTDVSVSPEEVFEELIGGILFGSDSGPNIDILAPGENITSATFGTGYISYSGTSMAAPHAAGAVAVLQEAYFNQFGTYATVDQIELALENSGVPITDPKNGITKPRIDVCGALEELNIQRRCPEIRGQIWQDDNGDGIRQTTETDVSGLADLTFSTIELLDGAGNPVTDHLGNSIDTVAVLNGGIYEYNFGYQAPGNYQIRINNLPSAFLTYSLSPANQGGDDMVDSDFDPNTLTATVNLPTRDTTINPQTTITNNDVGLRIATDIRVFKSVDNPTPNEGDIIEYTILVENVGFGASTNPASGIVVNDMLPAGVTYDSHTTTDGNYDPATGVWTPNVAPNHLNPQNFERLVIRATVDSGAAALTQPIINTATLDSVDQVDTDDTNDTSSVDITVQAPVASTTTLTLNSYTANAPFNGTEYEVYPGDTITVSAEVENTGANDAVNVQSSLLAGATPPGFDLFLTDTRTELPVTMTPGQVSTFESEFTIEAQPIYPQIYTLFYVPTADNEAVPNTPQPINFIVRAPILTNNDVTTDLAANYATNNWITCTPNPANVGDQVTCSGTLPNRYTAPNDMEVRIGNKVTICNFTGQNFTCDPRVMDIAGTFDVEVEIDFGGAFVDTGADVVVNLPDIDLEVFDYVVSDLNPRPGDVVTISYKIRNNDTTYTANPVEANYQIPASLASAIQNVNDPVTGNALVPGQVETVSFEIVIAAQASYPSINYNYGVRVAPFANPNFQDTNTANNELTQTFVVQAPVPPTLTNNDVTNDLAANYATNNWITCTPSPANLGDQVTCSGTLPNNYSPPASMEIRIDGNTTNCTLPNNNFTCNPVNAVNDGTFDVEADVEGTGNFVDTGADVIVNLPDIDLEVFDYTVSDLAPKAGDIVTISYKIRNNSTTLTANSVEAVYQVPSGLATLQNINDPVSGQPLAPGQVKTVSFEIVIANQAAYPSINYNYGARVMPSTGTANYQDTNMANNELVQTFVVQDPATAPVCPAGTALDAAGTDCIAQKVCASGGTLQADGSCTDPATLNCPNGGVLTGTDCVLSNTNRFPIYLYKNDPVKCAEIGGRILNSVGCQFDNGQGYPVPRDCSVGWAEFIRFGYYTVRGIQYSGTFWCGYNGFIFTPGYAVGGSYPATGITYPNAVCNPATPALDPNYTNPQYCKV
jgi:uncharacterized repeat protein (TIGR01451 family)